MADMDSIRGSKMDGNAFQIIATDDSVDVKPCGVCGAEKLLDDFYADKTGVLGRRSTCKQCEKTAKVHKESVTGAIEKALENAAYRLLKETLEI